MVRKNTQSPFLPNQFVPMGISANDRCDENVTKLDFQRNRSIYEREEMWIGLWINLASILSP